MFRKSTFMALLSLALLWNFSIAQTEPEKKKIKVQLWVNGKLHPVNQTLTKNDVNVQLRAYNAENNQELAVTLIDAALVRNGQKVAITTFSNGGSIENLVKKARNNDSYVFEVKQVMELAADMSLKPYTNKPFKINYLFFDSGLDNPKVATIGSN